MKVRDLVNVLRDVLVGSAGVENSLTLQLLASSLGVSRSSLQLIREQHKLS
jgi:hypothetical protein